MSKRSPGEGWGSLLFAGNIGAAYERPVRLRRKVLLNWRFQPEAGKASLRKPRDDRVDQGGVGCATDTGTLPPGPSWVPAEADEMNG